MTQGMGWWKVLTYRIDTWHQLQRREEWETSSSYQVLTQKASYVAWHKATEHARTSTLKTTTFSTSQFTERVRGPAGVYKLWSHRRLQRLIRWHTDTNCEPHMFREGDIVQAQVSFMATPVRRGKRKMLNVLCSLTLLEGCSANIGSIIHYKHHQISYNLQINERCSRNARICQATGRVWTQLEGQRKQREREWW